MTTYNSAFEGAFPFSDQTVQVALAANTELTYTVPGDNSMQYRADFSVPYNANIWIGYNITVTQPTPATATTTNRVERISNENYVRYVRGGDVLHFISNALVTDIGISLLRLPG